MRNVFKDRAGAVWSERPNARFRQAVYFSATLASVSDVQTGVLNTKISLSTTLINSCDISPIASVKRRLYSVIESSSSISAAIDVADSGSGNNRFSAYIANQSAMSVDMTVKRGFGTVIEAVSGLLPSARIRRRLAVEISSEVGLSARLTDLFASDQEPAGFSGITTDSSERMPAPLKAVTLSPKTKQPAGLSREKAA